MSEQIQLTQDKITELNKQPTIYVNSFYFMQKNAVIKIAMCEDNDSRVSVTMGVQEFMAFLDAAQGHKEFLDRAMAAHQESLKQ